MREKRPVPLWLMQHDLPDLISLQIIDANQNIIFSSSGKWLHPLLAAEKFLAQSNYDLSTLILHDRIAGRAAAALTIRMGFQTVKACLMSQLAQSLYETYKIAYYADQTIERIACQTEDLINDGMDLDTIHSLIKRRAE